MIFRLPHILIITLFAMAATGPGAAHPDEGVRSCEICSDSGSFFITSNGNGYCGELEKPSSNPSSLLNEEVVCNELRTTCKHYHETDGQPAVLCSGVFGGQHSDISFILANIRHKSASRLLHLLVRLNI